MNPRQQPGTYHPDHGEVHTISQVENPMPISGSLGPPGSSNGNVPPILGMNEDSNHSGKDIAIGQQPSLETSFRYDILFDNGLVDSDVYIK